MKIFLCLIFLFHPVLTFFFFFSLSFTVNFLKKLYYSSSQCGFTLKIFTQRYFAKIAMTSMSKPKNIF